MSHTTDPAVMPHTVMPHTVVPDALLSGNSLMSYSVVSGNAFLPYRMRRWRRLELDKWR
jgi:hypothetical protein